MQLPAGVPRKAAEEGLNAWAHAPSSGDLEVARGAWLQPAPCNHFGNESADGRYL